MSFTVSDVRINDVTSVQRNARTVTLDHGIPIDNTLIVDSLPAELSWSLVIEYSSGNPSRVLCAASVLDPRRHSIVTAWMSFEAEVGHGSREMLLSPFNAAAAGVYTVRLVVEAPVPITKELRVAVERNISGDRH